MLLAKLIVIKFVACDFIYTQHNTDAPKNLLVITFPSPVPKMLTATTAKTNKLGDALSKTKSVSLVSCICSVPLALCETLYPRT